MRKRKRRVWWRSCRRWLRRRSGITWILYGQRMDPVLIVGHRPKRVLSYSNNLLLSFFLFLFFCEEFSVWLEFESEPRKWNENFKAWIELFQMSLSFMSFSILLLLVKIMFVFRFPLFLFYTEDKMDQNSQRWGLMDSKVSWISVIFLI